MEGGLTGMEVITTAITNVGTILGSAVDLVTGEPIFMIGIGMSVVISGIGIAKRLIG